MSIIKFDNNLLDLFGETIYDTISKGLIDKLISYIIHSDYRKSVNLKNWIKEQVDSSINSVELNNITNQIPVVADYDRQVMEVLWWVHNNITYVGDLYHWNMDEYWCTAEETLSNREGDCEDGSILAYVLCRMKGIPSNRLLIMAGVVDDGKGNSGGHAYLAYKPKNYPLNFSFLDWCWYYTPKLMQYRNLFTLINKDIFEYKNPDFNETNSTYKNIWFVFNEETSTTNYKLEIKKL